MTNLAREHSKQRWLLVSAWLAAAGCVPNESPAPEGQAAPSAPATPRAAPFKPAPRPMPLRPVPAQDGSFSRQLTPDGQALRSAKAVSAPGSVTTKPQAPASEGGPGQLIKRTFNDFFERTELGPDWNATSTTAWRIEAGRLCGRSAKNHPVWLTRRLPVNARIEFDAISRSQDGDLKVEVWGDGKSAATGTSYTNATSYLAIFGGWKNQFHVLARMDEHAKGRPEVKITPQGGELRARPVQTNQVYHFKIERNDGKTVRWLVDDIEILSFTDPNPLKGTGHEHLGFNDWDVPVCFDNLSITPVEGS